MLLALDEASLFLSLYMSLIDYVAGRLGGVGRVKDLKTFRSASWDAKAKARDSKRYWRIAFSCGNRAASRKAFFFPRKWK